MSAKVAKTGKRDYPTSPITGRTSPEESFVERWRNAAAAVGAFFAGGILTRDHPTKDEVCARHNFNANKYSDGETYHFKGTHSDVAAVTVIDPAHNKELVRHIMQPVKENTEKDKGAFMLIQQKAQSIIDSPTATEEEREIAERVVLTVESLFLYISNYVLCVKLAILADLSLRAATSEAVSATKKAELESKLSRFDSAERSLQKTKQELQSQEDALQKLLSKRAPVVVEVPAIEVPVAAEAAAATPTTTSPQTPTSNMSTDSSIPEAKGFFAGVKAFFSSILGSCSRAWCGVKKFFTPRFIFSDSLAAKLNPTKKSK